MRKVHLIVHERYQGEHQAADAFATAFLTNPVVLTNLPEHSIINTTDRSQDSLGSPKGADYGTSEE